MKNRLLLLCTITFFTAFCSLAASIPDTGTCYVISVTDGDSFKALFKGKTITCRLSNIDARELKQAMGIAARDSLQKLIYRRLCSLVVIKKDLYGRWLVQVNAEEIDVQDYLVRTGLAWVNIRYSQALHLRELEATARADSVGLWQCPQRIPPWVYRGLSARTKRAFAPCI